MNIDAEIWQQTEDGDSRIDQGQIEVEATGDEAVAIHFHVGGSVVATATVDRFMAGALVGQLMTGASEAVRA